MKNDFKDAGRNVGKKSKEICLGVADGAKKGFNPNNGGKGKGNGSSSK